MHHRGCIVQHWGTTGAALYTTGAALCTTGAALCTTGAALCTTGAALCTTGQPQGLHYAQQGLHYAPQGLHYSPLGLHYAPQGLHYAQGVVNKSPPFTWAGCPETCLLLATTGQHTTLTKCCYFRACVVWGSWDQGLHSWV